MSNEKPEATPTPTIVGINFVPRDPLEHADAIIILTGNGWERTAFAVELFRQGWAPYLVMTGSTGSRPPAEMADYAKKQGVPEKNILIASDSNNTRGNAEEIVQLSKNRWWQTIILVTSPHHQWRAKLTLEKARQEFYPSLQIINYPPTRYSWFDQVESSRNKNRTHFRFWYLFSELFRILKYRWKGDL